MIAERRISSKNIFLSTAEIALSSLKIKDEKLGFKITTQAIANGINFAFAEEMPSFSGDELLRRIGSFTPYLIALNEMADIGVSAERRLNEGVPQSKILPLILLKGGLEKDLEDRKAEFLSKNDGNEEAEMIVNTLENDFLLLSRLRDSFEPEEYRDYIDLDSAIVELACLELVIPDLSKKIGIDYFGDNCTDKDSLKKKYGIFLTRDMSRLKDGDRPELSKKLLILHATEMVLKVHDDEVGHKLDKLLKIPNFASYAEAVSDKSGGLVSVKEVLKELEKDYLRIVQECGLSPSLVRLTKGLCAVTASIRIEKACKERMKFEDLLQVQNLVGINYFTSTLRHEIEMGLVELFSRPTLDSRG